MSDQSKMARADFQVLRKLRTRYGKDEVTSSLEHAEVIDRGEDPVAEYKKWLGVIGLDEAATIVAAEKAAAKNAE